MNELKRHFDECQLPVKFLADPPIRSFISLAESYCYIDVATHKRQEYFRVYVDERATLQMVDKAPAMRHILLQMQCRPEASSREAKLHYLLGHDERQLFVVGASGTSIRQSLDGLKPWPVRQAEARGLKVIRQGDWFFVPTHSRFTLPPDAVLYIHEVLGGPSGPKYGVRVGNPHVAEEQAIQIGPVRRYVDRKWQEVGRQITAIYVRGAVRHSEHATIKLRAWHVAYQVGGETQPSIGYYD
jgi:hypothetical protein